MTELKHPSARNRMRTYAIRRVAPPDFVRPPTRAKGPDDDVEISRVNEAESVTRVTGEAVTGGKVITATEKLYRTRDGRIVGKSDPDRLTLVALPGQQIVVNEETPYAPLRPRLRSSAR